MGLYLNINQVSNDFLILIICTDSALLSLCSACLSLNIDVKLEVASSQGGADDNTFLYSNWLILINLSQIIVMMSGDHSNYSEWLLNNTTVNSNITLIS